MSKQFKVTFKHFGKVVYSGVATVAHRRQAMDAVCDAHSALIREGKAECFSFDVYSVDEVVPEVEATHEVVNKRNGVISFTGTFQACMSYTMAAHQQAMTVRTLGETARIKAAQAEESTDSDDLSCMLAGLSELLGKATERAWDTAIPAHVMHAMQALGNDLAALSVGGEVAEPEYLYQMSTYRTDMEWINCTDEAQYERAISHGLPVRRFALVKE